MQAQWCKILRVQLSWESCMLLQKLQCRPSANEWCHKWVRWGRDFQISSFLIGYKNDCFGQDNDFVWLPGAALWVLRLLRDSLKNVPLKKRMISRINSNILVLTIPLCLSGTSIPGMDLRDWEHQHQSSSLIALFVGHQTHQIIGCVYKKVAYNNLVGSVFNVHQVAQWGSNRIELG